MVEWHDVRQGRGNHAYESKGFPEAASMVERHDVRQVRGNRVYESKGLQGCRDNDDNIWCAAGAAGRYG